MSDRPKSAVELAMEKLAAQDSMAVKPLTEEQKREVAEIRNRYKARIAGLEVKAQSERAKASDPQEIEKINQHLQSERERLTYEMEKAVEKVKS